MLFSEKFHFVTCSNYFRQRSKSQRQVEWYIQMCIPVERLSFSSSFSESNTTKISMHYKHKMHKQQQQQQRSRDTGWESQSFLISVDLMTWVVYHTVLW